MLDATQRAYQQLRGLRVGDRVRLINEVEGTYLRRFSGFAGTIEALTPDVDYPFEVHFDEGRGVLMAAAVELELLD